MNIQRFYFSWFIMFCIGCLFFTVDLVNGQESRWLFGTVRNIQVQGNYAYVQSGESVWLYDISAPLNPKLLSQALFNNNNTWIDGLFIKDSFMYVVSDKNFYTVDVSDKTNPFVVNHYETQLWNEKFKKIFVQGNFAYILGGYKNLFIFDVQTPSSPTLVTNFKNLPATGNDLFGIGQYIYIAGGSDGLFIVDVSNPSSPQLISQYKETSNVYKDIFVKDTLAYIASENKGLSIISVKDPVNPYLVGKYELPYDEWTAISVEDTLACLVAKDNKMVLINVADPTAPSKIPLDVQYTDSSDLSYFGYDVVITNGTIYSAHDKHFGIVQLKNQSTPYPGRKMFITYAWSYDIEVTNGYVYFAGGNPGAWIIDVSTPQKPMAVSYMHHQNDLGPDKSAPDVWDLAISGQYAYLGCLKYGIRVYDISNPTTPKFFKSISISPRSVEVKDNYIYVGTAHGEFAVVDISDTANFQIVARLDIGNQYDYVVVAVEGNYAYAGLKNNDLKIISISDPTNPQVVASILEGGISQVSARQNYIFVKSDSLYIMDVTDPNNPKQLFAIGGYYKWSNYYIPPTTFVASDNYLYVVIGDSIVTYDISNIHAPKRMGVVLSNANNLRALAVDNDYLYASELNNGLYIYKKTDLLTNIKNTSATIPIRTQLMANYPNPFNPSTTIRFELDSYMFIQLAVFDLTGRKIRTLLQGTFPKGNYEVTWDGKTDNGHPVGSGMYLYRLTTDKGFSQVRKMILIR